MKILVNTTKTMACGQTSAPPPLRTTRPRLLAEAQALAAQVRDLDQADLARIMDLSQALAAATRADLGLWGGRGRPAGPALGAFTGLVFKHLAPATLPAAAWRFAQDHLLILSGLYGLLRPCDRVEAYRLEMGCRFVPDGAATLTAFWRPRITAELNRRLRRGEPVINLAAGEYLAAVDQDALKGPVIWPVFKQRRPDGSLKVVTVHAKEARGLLARWILESEADAPADLLAFDGAGWEAAEAVPVRGPWLFVR
ncbi:MAG: YaaA family protein [Candidatus Krumholzibacteriia bacterium]